MAEINYSDNLETDNSLVMFAASWCVPCKRFTPTFERAAADHEGDIQFSKIDIDEFPELAGEYNVMSVPTIIRLVDGKAESISERRPLQFLNYVESL